MLEQGGEVQIVKGEYESWRVLFSDATITYYSTGTLYSTKSASEDPSVFDAWSFVDNLAGSSYALPSKDYLVGFDETGKGELFGHTVLAGALFPADLFSDVDTVIGSADTKKKHTYEYWDELFFQFDHLKVEGLSFQYETIPPWVVDRYNLNKIMDVSYQRLLNIFLRQVEMTKARIVIDDYGIGPTLQRYLNFLEKKGAEIVVVNDAESKYLAAKLASLVAKRYSQRSLQAIRKNPEYMIDGKGIGSGNAGDNKTIHWIDAWKKSGKDWPWFVKRSFKTIRELDGRKRINKLSPPINEKLLSKEYIDNFDKGKLSIQSLSLVCPNCGAILKSIRIAFIRENGRDVTRLQCHGDESCSREIIDAGPTLRYYCGFVLPDTNAISRKLLGRDLTRSRIFENYTLVLSPVVRYESDQMRGANQEFDNLRRFANMGRISLLSPDMIKDLKTLDNTERDEMIIQDCLDYNAIYLTADKKAGSFAIGKEIFTIMA